MKKIFFLVLLFPLISFSQTEKRDTLIQLFRGCVLVLPDLNKKTPPSNILYYKYYYSKDSIKIYKNVENYPRFDDDQKSFNQFVQENIKSVIGDSVIGKVYLKFIVLKTGEISQVSIVKGENDFYNGEAIRVVNMSPNWIPASHNGENVNCEMMTLVKFEGI
jgi:protein TonB